MTNLFTQLAARSLGLTPIVQPRIDSVFSPPAAEAIEPAVPLANEPAAIEQSSRAVGASLNRVANPAGDLLVPSVAHNASVLPIAHAPRSIAIGNLARMDDRGIAGLSGAVSENQMSHDRSPFDIEAANQSENETIAETNFEKTIEIDSAIDIKVNPAISRELTPVSIQNPSFPDEKPKPSSPNSVPLHSDGTASALRERLLTENSAASVEAVRQSRSEGQPSPDRSALPGSPDLSPTRNKPALRDRLDEVQPAIDSSSTAVSPEPPLNDSHAIDSRLARREAAETRINPPSIQALQSSQRTEAGSLDLLPGVMPRQTAARLPDPPPTAAQMPRSRPVSEAVPAALPTIQITIGRIEVRAVSTPAPARPRAVTPPARLSLEDYLRSRSGGDL